MFHLDPIARIWIRQAARRRGLDIIIPYPGTALDTAKDLTTVIKTFHNDPMAEQSLAFISYSGMKRLKDSTVGNTALFDEQSLRED